MPWKGNSSLNSDYFDPDAIAGDILKGASATNKPSLIPTMPTAPELTPRPAYTAPAKEEFDWDVPVSERPQGTENWIWSRSRWAKDNWDKEQQAKADEAYKQYVMDIDAWKDDADRKQREYEQQATAVKNYFDQQGLISPLPGDPTSTIRQAQSEWQKAYAAGNQQDMDYWHNLAEQARGGAGWGSGGVNGNATAGYLTNAGLPTWERQAGEAAAEAAAQQQAFENQLALAELERQQAETNYAISKPYYNPNSSGSSNNPKPTQNDYISAVLSAAKDYKTPANYKADLERYKDTIVAYIGLSNYNALIKDADSQIDSGIVNKSYVPGTKSPIGALFSSNFDQPSPGSVSSWINSAISAAGVGSEWAQPLAWLIQHESSGNPDATNPKSGAYGLMQFLPQTWGNYGYRKTSDPIKQIEAGINYIKARYGTAANAKAFWQKNGWY